jgi:hypothetical protein
MLKARFVQILVKESAVENPVICSISSSTKTELIPPPVNMSQVHILTAAPLELNILKNDEN